MESRNQRIVVFDLLRAYGCLAIVLLHVVSAWKDDLIYSETFYNSVLLRIVFDNAIVPLVVRAVVPFFFMISGALFLNERRDASWNSMWKHVKRIFSVLIVFGYPMSLIEIVVKNRDFELSSLWEGLLNVFQARTWSHLWYLYATIGLYILTPLLRYWLFTVSEKNMKQILLGSIILFSLNPTVNSVFDLEITSFGITSPNGALLYYLTGHYLYTYRNEIKKRRAVVTTGVAMGGGGTVVVGLLFREWNKSMLEPYHLWIYIYSASLFLCLVSSDKKNLNKKMMNIAGYVAQLSLAVYVIHPVFINVLYKGLHIFPNQFTPILGELLIWFGVSTTSIIGATILKKLPIVKNFL